MNKILNWFFGSCFRTLGRFLAIFIVVLLLIFIGSKIGIDLPDWLVLRTNAAEVHYNTNWAATLPQMDRVDFKSCSGSRTCNTVMSSQQDYLTFNYNNSYRVFNVNSDEMDIGSNGYIIESYANTRAGYLYEVNYYICSNKNIRSSMDVNIYATFWGDGINLGNTFNATYKTDLGGTPGDGEDGRTWNYCGLFGGFIVPDQNYAWTAIRFQRSSVLSDVYMSVISVEVNELGIYTDTIADLLNNSIENGSIASSEQVNEVKDQVTQVQDEIQNTNDNIMNSDSPDVSGMTNLAGYLPPGPLDSVLNLPLSILNSLHSKLSTTCSPLTLTLPFVNVAINIPCISTIFSQISGLNVLWESLGVILGAIIMYNYLVYLYNWVDDVTSLKHNRARLFGAKSDADNWGGVD